MNKNSFLYADEIDLIALFKIIWDGKIKILLITIISFFVGFVHDSKIPINYLNSLTIKPTEVTEFLILNNIQKMLKSNLSTKSNTARFIEELKDYEEFLLSIQNTKKIQEYFQEFNIKNEEEEKELFKYAKLLEVVGPIKNSDQEYIINFKWHNPEETRKILQDTLNLVTKNLKERIDLELDKIIELERKIILAADNQRLDYLKEQSAIAKELNIVDNQIDNVNLSQSSVSLSINTADIAYYLRGYRAIDKEIELIENRDYSNLKFIEQEVNSFKAKNVNFIDYNVYLMDHNSLKDSKLTLIFSILLGLVVGIIFVLISNAFQSEKVSKKN